MSIVKYDVHPYVEARTREEVASIEQHYIAIEKLTGYAEVPKTQIELARSIDPIARGRELATHRLLDKLKDFCQVTDEVSPVSGDVMVKAVFHGPYLRDSVVDHIASDLREEKGRSNEFYHQWMQAQLRYESAELELNTIKNQSVIKFAWRRLLKYWRKYITPVRAIGEF